MTEERNGFWQNQEGFYPFGALPNSPCLGDLIAGTYLPYHGQYQSWISKQEVAEDG